MRYLQDPAGRVFREVDAPTVNNLQVVVVISPEDREQVERLAMNLPIHWNLFQSDDPEVGDDTVSAFQAALREFANPTPPKPDEPQGLGAVVEDSKKRLWVRTDRTAPWSPIKGIGGDRATLRFWSELDPVRVLSEGVTND